MTPIASNAVGTIGTFKYETRLILPNSLEGFLFSPIKKYTFYTFNCILMKRRINMVLELDVTHELLRISRYNLSNIYGVI
uniref:Uncharacterized protein n=1 Tax=Staphylococcus epidermidis TaxID=1282 RepID=A0A0D4ZYM2_STAEP|nr:hypothetical protein [Staphylococcus epidermidis]